MTSHLQSISRVLGLNEHRKARNMLHNAALQLKLPFYILLLSIVFLSLGIMLGNIYFQETYNSMLATSTQPDYLQQVITEQAHEFKMLSLLLLAVYTALVTVVATIFTHRLIGPVVPIKRHIRALQQGRFEHRMKLREHDGLRDIADELNRLAETLERERAAP